MCGRYFIDPGDSRELRDIVAAIGRSGEEVKLGEIFPTNKAPILYGRNGLLAPQAAVWGFPRYGGKGVIINARAETAPEKRTFRESLFTRRCVVPTTGFYEWDGSKQKYLFRLPDTNTLYLAGIYNEFSGERRFTILTGAANDTIADVHDRMPVILSADDKETWLRDTDFALNYLNSPLPNLVRVQA